MSELIERIHRDILLPLPPHVMACTVAGEVFSLLLMMGIIWFVQVVHYPSFTAVSRDNFSDFVHRNSWRTLFLVGPLMVVEVTCASLNLFIVHAIFKSDLGLYAYVFSYLLLLLVWLSTFLVQVPKHRLLMQGYDPKVIAELIRSNWIRTVTWTMRAILLIYVVLQTLRLPEFWR